MSKLESLIKITKPEKLSKINRLEDKLKQQEYYGR